MAEDPGLPRDPLHPGPGQQPTGGILYIYVYMYILDCLVIHSTVDQDNSLLEVYYIYISIYPGLPRDPLHPGPGQQPTGGIK